MSACDVSRHLDAHITPSTTTCPRLAHTVDSSAEEEPLPQEVVLTRSGSKGERVLQGVVGKDEDAVKQEYDDELGQADKDKLDLCKLIKESDAARDDARDPIPLARPWKS